MAAIGSARAGEDSVIPGAVPLQDGSSPRRRESETRILSWESDVKIGSRPGVLTRLVEAYENLFDCVPEILQATDWIRCRAIEPTVFEGWNEGRDDLIGKLRPILRGSLVLEAWVAPLDGRRGEPTDGLEPGTTLLCERIIAVMILSPTDARSGCPGETRWFARSLPNRSGKVSRRCRESSRSHGRTCGSTPNRRVRCRLEIQKTIESAAAEPLGRPRRVLKRKRAGPGTDGLRRPDSG
jgi:hypothetical protein